MLTAIKDNQTIIVYQHPIDELKNWSLEKKLLCPDCRDILIFRECSAKQHHFAHISKDCSYPFREPESVEHEKGKMTLYQWIIQQFGENDCAIEHHISATNQRADTFVLPLSMAVEFQCSPIQDSTWFKRHQLYQSAGIKDIWILGYSMHKYIKASNPFIHKLNQLEQILLQEYGRLFYFDVLSEHFIVLIPQKVINNIVYGYETFYKPNECIIDSNTFSFHVKYDYFLNMQEKRRKIIQNLIEKEKKTDQYIQQLKGEKKAEKTSRKVLASDRQKKFIEDLLEQKNMKLPRKLHGLLFEEADAIIKELLSKKAK